MKDYITFLKISRTEKKVLIFICAVGIIGLFISSYLWYQYSQPTPLICASDCEKVRQSKYAIVYGVSMPVFGVLYYLFLLSLSFFSLFKRKISKLTITTLWIANFSALLFSGYLTYLEIWVIKGICQWCVASAICVTLLFVASTVTLVQSERKRL